MPQCNCELSNFQVTQGEKSFCQISRTSHLNPIYHIWEPPLFSLRPQPHCPPFYRQVSPELGMEFYCGSKFRPQEARTTTPLIFVYHLVTDCLSFGLQRHSVHPEKMGPNSSRGLSTVNVTSLSSLSSFSKYCRKDFLVPTWYQRLVLPASAARLLQQSDGVLCFREPPFSPHTLGHVTWQGLSLLLDQSILYDPLTLSLTVHVL